MHGPMWRATLEYVKRIEPRDTSAHALPDGHCVNRVVTYYLYAQESFNLGE
jgi:hypothetical protein